MSARASTEQPIVLARGLSKIYRLYTKPHYRFLDMFGLLRRRDVYTEHTALDRIDLQVRRGEKVAIIGRNGAGKSTLLKLVTGVIRPTAGEITVPGHVHALLQIGTGFHPDFTGRQNVHAYLAQLGITGRAAARKAAEIVDFAELEDYIDQPVKTYSTGMAVRLMFSTSTAITPDVLVLDEVLGVGDAYFAQKSYERMRELCEGAGTTLLLVTHDVYSALKIASRVVWIDRGRILMDGDGPTVVKGYEDSIRVQEEERLRLKKQQNLRAAEARERARPVKHLILEVQGKEGRPQPCPVYFSRIALFLGDTLVAALPLGETAFAEGFGTHLHREASCWGDEMQWEGRAARPMLNYGTAFHKVAGVFAVPETVADLGETAFGLVLDYWSAEPCELVLRCFVQGREATLGILPPSQGKWVSHAVEHSFSAAASAQPAPPREINTSGVQGTGAIVVEGVSMLDGEGRETHFAVHGQPVTLLMPFRVVDPKIRERAQVAVAFHKDGVQTACRLLARELFFDAETTPCGTVRLHIPRLTLGNGNYLLTVMIAREGYYDQEQTVFYSINSGVYCCLARLMEVNVSGGGLIADGTSFVGEGEWSLAAVGEATAHEPVRAGAAG